MTAQSEGKLPGYIAVDKDNEETSQEKISRKKKMKRSEKRETNKRGVVLLSHIPHGFYEPQMFSFFSQFGRVTRLKLIRSRKTGKSRQFAFIEFQFEEVAKIAAETMNNYLMFQKILKCKLIPTEEVKPTTFRNWQYKYHVPKMRKKAIAENNACVVDPNKIAKKRQKTLEKRKALQKKIDDLGIDYDVFNIKVNAAFIPPERTRASFEDVEKLKAKEQFFDECFSDLDGERSEMYDDETQEESTVHEPDYEVLPNESQIAGEQLPDSAEPSVRETETIAQDEKENDFGVMVVDLDDSEVTFKTPPAQTKIKRKSIRTSKVEMHDSGKAIDVCEDSPSTPKSAIKKAASKRKKIQEVDYPSKLSQTSRKMDSIPATAVAKRKKTAIAKKKSSKNRSKFNQTL